MSFNQCNLCGNERKKEHLYRIDRFDVPFHIVKCSKCELIYQHPQLPQDYYDEGYYAGKNTYSYTDEREDAVIRKVENRRRLNNIMKHMKKDSPSLLDIGCSFGSFIETANEAGFIAKGVDTSDYIMNLTEDNDNIAYADICADGVRMQDEGFDVITIIETIEHLVDPNNALANCYDSLNDNGLLVIQTTNMDSLVRKHEKDKSGYFLPGHTFYFSIKTLDKMLQKNGFKIEKIYYGHETGLIPALIRKMLTNLNRHKFSDFTCFLYTVFFHFLSKLHIGRLAVHNGVVVYARKRSEDER